METRHDLEHTTERLTEGLRCPWKWGHYRLRSVPPSPVYGNRLVGGGGEVRVGARIDRTREQRPRELRQRKG